jgi:signal transduction histidine kinase
MPGTPGKGAGKATPAASFEELEHELRTPLASMRSVAEILRDYPDMTELQRRQFLDGLIQESERLHLTLERVLAWVDASEASGEVGPGLVQPGAKA